ncbi:Lysophospholipid acyltransferase LPEAT2 [Camellia lanceoleosa]|uniref:Lysophospholipid acyltransferase LPEAT2 n=1 Tax=Camellia lanceoleosa TaxID=1840588 RepID=A0ACC0IIV9_9ERIC|nr:Lysophospholipid acyltransferase LPEAT2 [Camellia lanceoleosa]
MNISQWNNNFKKIGLHSLSSLTSLWIQEDEEEEEVIVRYPHVHFDQSWGNIALGKLVFRMFIDSQFHGVWSWIVSQS